MTLRLSFHGGAGTVTGSRHLVETDSCRFLVDAGLFQGLKKLRALNWKRPGFDPEAVDFLFLTHAHIDHAGYLPRLVKDGFRQPIYCTRATYDLAQLMLMDSAKIQEEDADYANRKGFSKHKPALPLYTSEDAAGALGYMEPVDYGTWIEPSEGVRARFLNIGHILGASMVEVHLDTGARTVRIVFSGDVGRYDVPLHSDPDPRPGCDFLVVESTYGDRDHKAGSVEEQIREALIGCLDRNGTVLIPAFAVGRSQLVTLCLRQLIKAGRLPEVPIHIDSPMAVDATRIYSRHIEDLSLDDSLNDDGRTHLFPHNVQFHRSVKESIKLNTMPGPRIIISASGMLTAGRVLHHLKRLLPDERNLIMLSGYQAPGTRGRAMMEGKPTVRVHGKDVPVRAQFIPLSGLSAHADRTELLKWVRSAGDGEKPPDGIFVVHGEPKSAGAFAELLNEKLATRTFLPDLGVGYDLLELLER
jgi:metallo-beta-lactamase family protein